MDLTQRTKERFARAVEALEKGIALPPLPERANRDSVLLRFELSAELMPRLLGRMLAEQGRDVLLPKDSVRTALAAGFFDEETAKLLLHAIDDRNRMVHDYSETFADALCGRIKDDYLRAFRKLAQL